MNWKKPGSGDRWLLRGTTRGRLIRHGIARLWWVTDLTRDAKCEHPLSKVKDDEYAYTSAVFQNEDRINALFDREAGAISSVVRSVLEHVGKEATYERDNHVRALMKELTLVMGFRDLGLLRSTDLDGLIEEVRPRYAGDDSVDGPAGGASLALTLTRRGVRVPRIFHAPPGRLSSSLWSWPGSARLGCR